MWTWIVSIETSSGENLWSEENRELGFTIFDLWQSDEALHLFNGGNIAYDDRLTGKVRPVLKRMEEERDRHSHDAMKGMFGTIEERLSLLDPEEELAITLMDY
ncbi:hypothetical protein GCM10023166_21020 [Paeniglutamicibacter cryotolerans]